MRLLQLRKLRKARGLSQGEVVKLLAAHMDRHMTCSRYSRMEREKLPATSQDLLGLAQIFNTTVDDLYLPALRWGMRPIFLSAMPCETGAEYTSFREGEAS